MKDIMYDPPMKKDILYDLLWYPHYWGKCVNGNRSEAVLLLECPMQYQVLEQLKAIAGHIPCGVEQAKKFNETHQTYGQFGWLCIGRDVNLPDGAKVVWSAGMGDKDVIIGEGNEPEGAVPYFFRLLDGVNYEVEQRWKD